MDEDNRTTKERVLALYPNAVCKTKSETSAGVNRWTIWSDDDWIANSYLSEEHAWKWALDLTNREILQKFRD
jgi:hypothetical protein